MKHHAFSIGALLALTMTAHASTPIKVETANGVVIAGSNSYKTLYNYAGDAGGVPSCYDECARQWPPHLAEYYDEGGGAFTIVDRKDGKKQWAKDGKPLYFSSMDKKKGDTNGDGAGGEWQAARP